MLLEKQYDKVWMKLEQMEKTYEKLIFRRRQEVPMHLWECREHYRKVPEGDWRPVKKGERWGGSGMTGWFVGELTVPQALAGENLYLEADTGALEAMLFVNGEPKGVYAHRIVANNRGNHHTLMIGKEAERFELGVEAYCWHNGVGTQPFAEPDLEDKVCVYNGVWLCTMEKDVKEFVFDLRILNQLRTAVRDEFRRARVENCLWQVYGMAPQKPEEEEEDRWHAAIRSAVTCMQAALREKNAELSPSAGLIGHSHLDTAWQWTIDETIRKCARTTSNALNLMEQYEDYIFFQSSAYHGELMRRNYPSIYKEVRKRVAEGRFEPNGGVWIECDCNLVSGESLIRQFLWGQRWTKEHYGYTSDVFWLPDTFGYSAALPQILKGCGISYFLTTKLMWNETNAFPYDTFVWRGIDGSTVFSHFNDIHCKPDPEHVISSVHDWTRLKRVNQDRLIAYGYGDGGGGPSYDMVEMAGRIADVNGCPRTRHTTVSSFMKKLEAEAEDVPVHSGELYLELHRGTLTSFHDIKKNNRRAERAFHDLEFAQAVCWLLGKRTKAHEDWYETLLVNQFHDILPGTCIPEVNRRAVSQMRQVIRQADDAFTELWETADQKGVSLINTLPWERDSAYVPAALLEASGEGSSGKGRLQEEVRLQGTGKAAACAQRITNLEGEALFYLEKLQVPGFGSQSLVRCAQAEERAEKGRFFYAAETVSTPFYEIVFDENGYLSSLYDKTAGRELARSGADPLNAFYLPEDVPCAWDNWDIDADVIERMRPVRHALVGRSIAAEGRLQLRIRSVFALTERTRVEQDMVLYANQRRIDFETRVDWHEKHRLLKAGFDMDINAAFARHEIQFGFMERPCFKSNTYEKAMFEVLNHKYTDVSETRFGAALLNDCKYGISVNGTQLALSLLKSGTHPDPCGDEGIHSFTYSLVTHDGFGWENVIKPAYELNYPMRPVRGVTEFAAPVISCDQPHVILETVKVAEDQNGIILRMYESERSGCRVKLTFSRQVRRVYRTDLLEEVQEELALLEGSVSLSVKAFEIVTLRLVI